MFGIGCNSNGCSIFLSSTNHIGAVKKIIDGLKQLVEEGKKKIHIWQSKLQQARGCVVKEEEEEAKLDENYNNLCAWSKEVGKARKI